MQLPDIDNLDDAITTIAGDDRYGSAVRIYEQSPYATSEHSTDTLILAPGQQESLCMLGNHLSHQLSAPLLLVKQQSIPDIVERALENILPHHIILVGGETHLSASLEAKLHKLKPHAVIKRIPGDTAHDVALNAYATYGPSGTLAVLTWDGCTNDILSLFPYTLPTNAALFYLRENGVIDGKLRELLESVQFDTLLAVGGQISLPDELLATLPAGLKIERLCGDNPTHANRLINSWIDIHCAQQPQDAVILSATDSSDALILGSYLLDHPARVLFEDANDLDSIASAVATVSEIPRDHQLTFFGGETLFSDADKMLLAKSHQKGA